MERTKSRQQGAVDLAGLGVGDERLEEIRTASPETPFHR
jgi:hypothetical protein